MNTDDPPEQFSLMTRAEPRVAIHFDVDTIDVRIRVFWGRRPVVESSQTENSGNAVRADSRLVAGYGPRAADAGRRSLITAIADCAALT